MTIAARCGELAEWPSLLLGARDGHIVLDLWRGRKLGEDGAKFPRHSTFRSHLLCWPANVGMAQVVSLTIPMSDWQCAWQEIMVWETQNLSQFIGIYKSLGFQPSPNCRWVQAWPRWRHPSPSWPGSSLTRCARLHSSGASTIACNQNIANTHPFWMLEVFNRIKSSNVGKTINK